MKNAGAKLLAIFGGAIGGFILYEIIVRIIVLNVSSVPWELVGLLSMVLPAAGAITTLLLLGRRKRQG